MVTLTLVSALIALIVWFVLTFIIATGLGIVHLLLALGVVLLIRWYAVTN